MGNREMKWEIEKWNGKSGNGMGYREMEWEIGEWNEKSRNL